MLNFEEMEKLKEIETKFKLNTFYNKETKEDIEFLLTCYNRLTCDIVNLKEKMETLTGIRTLVDNDVNVIAQGEAIFGAAKGHKSSITVALGTLIPTSMTVVETRMSVDPEANASMTAVFSSGFIRPVRESMRMVSGSTARSLALYSATFSISCPSPSSTAGQIT